MKAWVSALVLFCSSLFGQKTPPSCVEECASSHKISSGYSASARCCLQNAWDVFFNGSFIFWSPHQENMELGIVSRPNGSVYTVDGHVTSLESKYSPGFQIGAGINLAKDAWDAYTQYTWVRCRNSATTQLSPSLDDQLSPFWQIPPLGGGSNPNYFNGHEVWKLHMDLLNAELARTYFVGSCLVLKPYFGARAAFIRQRISVQYLNETSGTNPINVYVIQQYHSWGVGPRTGFNSSWDIGKNCRLFGNGACDILFTQYRKLGSNQYGTNAAGNLVSLSGFHLSQKTSNELRGHVELEFGFGWKTVCDNRGWLLDLSAAYTYQIFFDQNMFRHFVNSYSYVSLLPCGNLYIHGLTASARCDF